MNSILPNMRLLSLPSENHGADWWELSNEIDSVLESYGLDLSHEETYLVFSETGECRVSRSVIGPKKAVIAPYILSDWEQAPVHRKTLSGETHEEILEESHKARFEALKDDDKTSRAFMICIRRELKPDLKIFVEAIYHE